jgi:hypothetical protein
MILLYFCVLEIHENAPEITYNKVNEKSSI